MICCNFCISWPDGTQEPAKVNYTNEIIRHVKIAGLYDDEVRRDIYSQINVEGMKLKDLVQLIEAKETAIDALQNVSVGAMSQFKGRKVSW